MKCIEEQKKNKIEKKINGDEGKSIWKIKSIEWKLLVVDGNIHLDHSGMRCIFTQNIQWHMCHFYAI